MHVSAAEADDSPGRRHDSLQYFGVASTLACTVQVGLNIALTRLYDRSGGPDRRRWGVVRLFP